MKFFLAHIRPSKKGYDLTYVAYATNGSRTAYTLRDVNTNLIRCEIGDEAMNYFSKRAADHKDTSVPLTAKVIQEFSKSASGYSGHRL